MPRGRPPKPLELPPEQAGPPAKPKTIAKDEVASALWDELVDLLSPHRVLSPVDGPTLTALCSSYSLLVKARDLLETEGITIHNGKSGATKIHPAVNLASGAARDVRAMASEMGLSPTSRARILHLQEQDDVEDMDAFLDADG